VEYSIYKSILAPIVVGDSYICNYCGMLFIRVKERKGNDLRLFCSKECASRHNAILRKGPVKFNNIYISECIICRKIFGSTRSKQLYCSIECKKKVFSEASFIRSVINNANKVCKCVVCGREFHPIYASKDRTFCSSECMNKDHQQRKRILKRIRRARIRDRYIEYVDIDKLLETQNNICPLCGKIIGRDTSYPNIYSPSIDHILPLSRGGQHSYYNCQAVHFTCNSRKGARIVGEFE
jgi:5-methylcytosine-specific restriction endonuclease McrA